MAFRQYPVKEVMSIHDGDTLTVHLDLGLDQCHIINLRLLGVFAAELRTPGGPAAQKFVADWFANHKGALSVYTVKTPRGHEASTLGRWVGDVHEDTSGDSLCVAAMAWLAEHPESAGGTGAP
jgi:hypothetical protein